MWGYRKVLASVRPSNARTRTRGSTGGQLGIELANFQIMESPRADATPPHAGKKLKYDATASRVTNSTEASDYLKRQYRPNWTLNG